MMQWAGSVDLIWGQKALLQEAATSTAKVTDPILILLQNLPEEETVTRDNWAMTSSIIFEFQW
jgi:hypothetical protein